MKKFLYTGAVIVIGAIIINYALGGFKPLQPSLISAKSIVLYGKPYEGRYNSDALDELIDVLRNRIAESNQNGILTIVNYNQQELEKRGVVKQFVGIQWEQSPAAISGLDSIVIDAYNGVQFVVPVKPLVMPSPVKLKLLAEEMAESMETTLQGLSIEQYRNSNLIINFPFSHEE